MQIPKQPEPAWVFAPGESMGKRKKVYLLRSEDVQTD